MHVLIQSAADFMHRVQQWKILFCRPFILLIVQQAHFAVLIFIVVVLFVSTKPSDWL